MSDTRRAGIAKILGLAAAISLAVPLPSSAALSTLAENASPLSAFQDEQAVLPGAFLPPVRLLDEPMLLAFSDSTTSGIVNRLGQAERECGALPEEYRVDCLAQGYKSAASATQNRPDYTTAQTELNKASRSLSGLVSQNEDKTAAPIKKGGKTYRAVKKAAVKQVAAKAKAVISETETKLLRSASSGLRKTHYARVAQAVGSTKKILRS
ncbi:MAG: hypothetical protein WBO55_03430 [Rhizobiaceae bacterium]